MLSFCNSRLMQESERFPANRRLLKLSQMCICLQSDDEAHYRKDKPLLHESSTRNVQDAVCGLRKAQYSRVHPRIKACWPVLMEDETLDS